MQDYFNAYSFEVKRWSQSLLVYKIKANTSSYFGVKIIDRNVCVFVTNKTELSIEPKLCNI